MFAVCVFCVYDYVLQSAGSRLDSSLTKMNHPAKPLGDQQAFWDSGVCGDGASRHLPPSQILTRYPLLLPSVLLHHLRLSSSFHWQCSSLLNTWWKLIYSFVSPLFPPFPSSIQISTHAYITLTFYLILFLSFPALYLLCYLGNKQNWKASSPRCIYRHMTSSWLI